MAFQIRGRNHDASIGACVTSVLSAWSQHRPSQCMGPRELVFGPDPVKSTHKSDHSQTSTCENPSRWRAQVSPASGACHEGSSHKCHSGWQLVGETLYPRCCSLAFYTHFSEGCVSTFFGERL